MAARQTETNWREDNSDLSAQTKLLTQFFAALGLVLFGVWIGAQVFGGDGTSGFANENLLAFFTNVYTEVLSITITVVVIGLLADWWRVKQLKDTLTRKASSRSNTIALDAIDDLRFFGWLSGEAGLLQRADLTDADLTKANLYEANLRGADLGHAILKGANLRYARLHGANLNFVNLDGARMRGTSLDGADFKNASLKGANLRFSHMSGARVVSARMDETTILPDGTRYDPKQGIKQMRRFGCVVD